MLDEFAGRLAIVTGAAEGIGAMLAEGFARADMAVAVLDIRQDQATRTAARLNELGTGDCFAVSVDVSERDAVFAAADKITQRPEPWGLVWINAGVGAGASLVNGHPRSVEWAYGVNVLGAIWTAQAFLPPLYQAEGARHIGFTASSAALASPAPPLTLYAASKHASMGIAEALRAEAAVENIPMTVLCPGLLNTDIWDAARARPEKYGGVRRMDPSIATPWRDALSPETMWPHIADNIAVGGGYLACLPPGGRDDDIKKRFADIEASIVTLDAADGFSR